MRSPCTVACAPVLFLLVCYCLDFSCVTSTERRNKTGGTLAPLTFPSCSYDELQGGGYLLVEKRDSRTFVPKPNSDTCKK